MVFQILDGEEIEFPFAEPRIFVDLESGLKRAVTPAAVRKDYLRRFEEFMQAHRDLFRELEMPHCVVRTDQNPWHALALFLAERQRLQ